jgi:hypothetical protein
MSKSDKKDEEREAANLRQDDKDKISADNVKFITACYVFENAIKAICETEGHFRPQDARKFKPHFKTIDDGDIKSALSYLQRYLKD